MTEKLCLFCEHFVFSLGGVAWSEYTPGEPGYVHCRKEHYYYIEAGSNYRALIENADSCPDFEWRQDIKDEFGVE